MSTKVPDSLIHPAMSGVSPRERKLAEPVLRRVLGDTHEFREGLAHARPPEAPADLVLAAPEQPHDPASIFWRLRWGGLLAFASPHAREAEDVARRYAESGFLIERGPASLRDGWLRLPLLSHKVHYFTARKVLLIPQGASTERFTYHVRLAPRAGATDPWVVVKEVPALEAIVSRLKGKFPDLGMDVIERRARKFTDKIFPVFLTREAAILKILQEHLPEPYCRRVPRVVGLDKDERGYVRRLTMNWLRNGGPVLSQMEFAHQSADLLRVLHDIAHVIHLDLRLDNFVITPRGVGFVDFGSAVRDDENVQQNPLLGSLFEELMRTSQIQRMLSQMTQSGYVTSHIIRDSHRKVDKAVDFFYLAVQFNAPHSNPDLADLIRYDPASPDARDLARLTAEVLRPKDPAAPAFRSAKDILHGIERMQLKLDKRPEKRQERESAPSHP